MAKKYFGTDGIRGRVGEAPITADFILKLGWAAGRVLAHKDARSVVIGKDTRVSGYMFESALEAGLAAAGANVALLGPMPTPAVAYLTRTLYACAGIVISASHNPYFDNGVKFFSELGEKLPDATEREIEAGLELPIKTVDSAHMGKAKRIDDAAGRYIEFCKGTVPFGSLFRGMRIVVDCANGSTYKVGPAVLSELGARVHAIGNKPDGLNINQDSGSGCTEALQREVLAREADLGIAFDGDGDRVVMIDRHGQLVDGDQILYIIAVARHSASRLQGQVVGTVMSNLGLEQALAKVGIGLFRTQVGDRYVHQVLTKNGWNLGGESSGHILCLDRTSTGDGIISALQVLEIMSDSGKALHELAAGMSKFPQTMINVQVTSPDAAMAIESSTRIQDAVRQIEAELSARGRVILRPSGTEPVVRVTLEGEDAAEVDSYARQLAELVATEIG